MTRREKAEKGYAFSVRVAVGLLFLLSLCSLLGTFPSKPVSDETPGARLANAIIWLTSASGGRELYQSPFFLALLGLFAAFLALAAWKQILTLRGADFIAEGPATVTRAAETGLSEDAARLKLFRVLRSAGFKPLSAARRQRVTGSSFLAVKNRIGIWGPLGMHLGFLVVLAAGFVTRVGAEVREIEIPENGRLYLDRERTSLVLQKFSVIPYAGTDRPSQYQSRFSVKGPVGDDRRYEILGVNRPLEIGRTKIFQMRYRVEVPRAEVRIYEDGLFLQSALLEKGKTFELPGGGLHLRYEDVVPDFRIGRAGEIFSASSDFRNPALKLDVGAERPRWVFRGRLHGHDENAASKWDFSLVKLHKVYFSGVRVSNDPGIPIAWAGYGVLVFSAFLSSFSIPRFVRVLLERQGEGERTEVRFEGVSKRDLPGLQEEISRLVRGTVGAEGASP